MSSSSALELDRGDDDRHDENDEELAPLENSSPLDERILSIVRNASTTTKNDDGRRRTVVRPALLASELGLSVEEATRELCGLLSAVGGGEDGASFVFERVEMPSSSSSGGGGGGDAVEGSAAAATMMASAAAATTMAFTFPADFETRAKRYRRRSEWKHRLRTIAGGVVKAVKVFTAFGLIVSLAVLIVAAICLLVAAVIALARGGQGGGGNHRNHPLMHRLRYLFFQLRSILWLYAVCGSSIDSNADPFLRECAGDVAFAMSMFCGNPMHPFFWFRVGGMRRRWARARRTRGWGGGGNYGGSGGDGIAMMRRGTWGDDDDDDGPSQRNNNRSFDSSGQEQRGLLSIAVEFLFGPNNDTTAPDGNDDNNNSPPARELEKWKFRASIIMTLSAKSQNDGVSLRDLLPFVDNPPAAAEDPSAMREALRIVTYFNGRPIDVVGKEATSGSGGGGGASDVYSGMDARFCFPEIVAEMDCQKLIALGSSEFAPPAFVNNENRSNNIASILYKEEEYDFGSSSNASDDIPDYLYERPFVLTELSRQQFGRCATLGFLNFVGLIIVQSAVMPGGLLELPVDAGTVGGRPRSSRRSGSASLIALASVLVLKLLHVLRFYAGLFFMLPVLRLVIVLIRNYGVDKRNQRRLNFVRVEL